MEVARSHRQVVVALPPGPEQLCDGLAAPIPLLRLADPLNRILTAEREERIAYPPAPLLKAAQGPTLGDAGVQPTPAPDRQHSRKELSPPLHHFSTDVGREGPGLRVLGAG